MSKLSLRLLAGLASFGAAAGGIAAIVASSASLPASAADTTTSTAPTSTTSTTLGPPAQGQGRHALFMYVDTVTGAGSNPAPAAGCAQTNLFEPGQVVVFRMDGVNVAAGGINLTGANVANAWVKIPGLKAIPMFFGNHGTNSYWTGAWTIAKNYPLGIVDFAVHVVTKPVPATSTAAAVPAQSGIFTQAGLAPPSRLTVVKA